MKELKYILLNENKSESGKLYDSNFITFWKRKNNISRSVVARGLRGKKEG